MVSEMNQPASDPTTLIRPQATPASTTGSEPEDDDADMLGEFFYCLGEGVRLLPRVSSCSFSLFPLTLILSVPLAEIQPLKWSQNSTIEKTPH